MGEREPVRRRRQPETGTVPATACSGGRAVRWLMRRPPARRGRPERSESRPGRPLPCMQQEASVKIRPILHTGWEVSQLLCRSVPLITGVARSSQRMGARRHGTRGGERDASKHSTLRCNNSGSEWRARKHETEWNMVGGNWEGSARGGGRNTGRGESGGGGGARRHAGRCGKRHGAAARAASGVTAPRPHLAEHLSHSIRNGAGFGLLQACSLV